LRLLGVTAAEGVAAGLFQRPPPDARNCKSHLPARELCGLQARHIIARRRAAAGGVARIPETGEIKMKLYGHPWSVNTRKTLMTLAEKGREAEFILVMVPKGEQKSQEHLARHPFGKVPVLDDDGFVLYETRAINRYIDGKFDGPSLTPPEGKGAARLEQWMNVADAYFVPYAHALIVEKLFRQYLGGEQNVAAIRAGREGMQPALDVVESWLASHPYLAGSALSLADIHWMPYVDYLFQIGEGENIAGRASLSAWWKRVSSRETWARVARTGPQPYEAGMTVDVIERKYRGV
jgi:glutathione S-transferase